jgi:hypothetical protein
MTTTYTIMDVFLLLAIAGFILGPNFSCRKRSRRSHDRFVSENDSAIQRPGNDKKIHAELNERRKYIETLNICTLTKSEREHYLVDCTERQSKFADRPKQTIIKNDRLMMEDMHLHAYPNSDFEQPEPIFHQLLRHDE